MIFCSYAKFSSEEEVSALISLCDWPQTSVSAIPGVWLVQSPAPRVSPNKSWSYSVSASATDQIKALNHSGSRGSVHVCVLL